jgi:hypothetical protein
VLKSKEKELRIDVAVDVVLGSIRKVENYILDDKCWDNLASVCDEVPKHVLALSQQKVGKLRAAQLGETFNAMLREASARVCEARSLQCYQVLRAWLNGSKNEFNLLENAGKLCGHLSGHMSANLHNDLTKLEAFSDAIVHLIIQIACNVRPDLKHDSVADLPMTLQKQAEDVFGPHAAG